MLPTLVFSMRSNRGERIKATKEVEKSISMIATSPSSFSYDFENGSVVYNLKPFDVPKPCVRKKRHFECLDHPAAYQHLGRYCPD
jgi:hypothetical protein